MVLYISPEFWFGMEKRYLYTKRDEHFYDLNRSEQSL